MKIDVKMPKLGESLTEGTILRWLKQVGDTVEKDETLLEVSTDKVDSEIPSPEDGTLVEILAQENETVEVDTILARLETEKVSETKETKTEKPQTSVENGKSKKEKQQQELPPPETPQEQIVDIVMPKLGESLTEGTIQKWLKQPGDSVEKDETIAEVSTDKVDSEIPSPLKGTLHEILANEGDTVEVNHAIAKLKTGDAAPKSVAPAEGKPKAEDDKKVKTSPVREDEGKKEAPVKVQKHMDGRFFSPLVRSIAAKEGIAPEELVGISGSGKQGRVTKNDILNYLESRKTEPEAKPTSIPGQKMPEAAPGEVIPMDTIRRQIADHMKKSLDTSAHVYSVSECDMTKVMNLLKAKRPEFQKQEGFKLTVTPFILHAVAKALVDFPRVNASLEDDNIILKKNINLGIAVASQKGLIVPVVKKAEEKNFRGLARSVNELVTRTRDNKLNLDDVQGSTFSVTNYGIFGNIIGLPIINQPNLAILGIGAIKKRPVVIESPGGDSIAIRSMAYISMSYDHRVIDGELGGRFMQRLVEYLENMDKDIL